MTAHDLPLGCFGKLPFWPEYLEFGVSYATSRALKAFLLAGRSELEGREEVPANSRVVQGIRFVIALPASVELLVGYLRPSTDLGGLRRFPFAVFVHLPRRSYGRHFRLLPTGLDGVWNLLEDAWSSVAELASEAGFREAIAATRVPMPRSPGEARAIYEAALDRDMEGLFAGHVGARVDGLPGGLRELISRLKSAKGAAQLTVELPVSAGIEEATADTSVWLDLLGRQFWRMRIEPSFFLDARPQCPGRGLILRFGELEPRDFPLLFGLRDEADGVLRPAEAPPAAGTTPPAGTRRNLVSWRIGG